MWCVAWNRPNPGEGLMSFDNFLYAILNVLVVTTMANWSDLTNPLWTANSSLVAIYMISLIFVAAFFAVNLVLVRGRLLPYFPLFHCMHR
jgi:hypothetical protein